MSLNGKLSRIVSVLILLSLGVVTALVWFATGMDAEITAAENNAAVNRGAAWYARRNIASLIDDAAVFVSACHAARKVSEEALAAASSPAELETASAAYVERKQAALKNELFGSRQELAAVIARGGEAADEVFVNDQFFRRNEVDRAALDPYTENTVIGPPGLYNVCADFSGLPVLAAVYMSGGETITVFFSAEELSSLFGSGANPTFMTNAAGTVLIHPDQELVKAKADMTFDPVYLKALTEHAAVKQTASGGYFAGLYKKAQDIWYTSMLMSDARAKFFTLVNRVKARGAILWEARRLFAEEWETRGIFTREGWRRIFGGVKKAVLEKTEYTALDGGSFVDSTTEDDVDGIRIVTYIPADVVFEGSYATARRNLYLAAGVWALAMLFLRFFSRSLTKPLEELTRAAGRIENGYYHLELKNKNLDETGILSRSVQSMSHVLANFEAFTNKSIARLARQGKLETGGVQKNATIFFSDIRSFTAISEKLTPEEIVDFLNDYLERMVSCVLATGGVIDKFIGDAVFAHWGAVEDTGTPEENALAGVRNALMMRAALACFNDGRGGDKKPVIRIGCGINSGQVIAGQIGSDERIEFTLIGDAVSFADRTETFNKPFGTEILISENAWKLAGEYLVTQEMPSVVERGEKIRMFAVINMKDEAESQKLMDDIAKLPKINMEIARRYAGPDGPKTIEDVRALIGIPTPDLSSFDPEGDEKKYKLKEEQKK